jgi:hypothetical protein
MELNPSFNSRHEVTKWGPLQFWIYACFNIMQTEVKLNIYSILFTPVINIVILCDFYLSKRVH